MRVIPRTFKIKMMLIAIASLLAVFFVFFLHLLSIQALLVIWNVAVVLGIVTWERERARRQASETISFSKDERWATLKREITWTENQLQKTYESERRQVLKVKLSYLNSELRRLEWAIKEGNLDALYRSQKGGLNNSNKDWDSRDRPHNSIADLEQDRIRAEKSDRKSLDQILTSVTEFISEEPEDSLPEALSAISNTLTAQYNVIKKRDKTASTLADYWVALMLVQALIKRAPVERKLLKYATKPYAPKFTAIFDAAVAHIEGPEQPRDGTSDSYEPSSENSNFHPVSDEDWKLP